MEKEIFLYPINPFSGPVFSSGISPKIKPKKSQLISII